MGEEKDKHLFNIRKVIIIILVSSILFILLYFSSLYNYLFYHSIIELFSICIAYALFVIVWNSKKYNITNFLLFLGTAYFFIASLDLLHTLSYKGMNIFIEYDSNLTAQMWISARYIESISILLSFIFLKKKAYPTLIFIGYITVCSILSILIFLRIFPACYIEEKGLTLFKVTSEYIICFLIIVSIFLLVKNRRKFNKRVYYLVFSSLISTILSEISFTLYRDVFGFFNFIGHIFKCISFYLIYKAIIETGLRSPYNLLFKELNDKSERLAKSEKRYRTLFEYAPIGICIVTMDGTIVVANAKLCAYLMSPHNGLHKKKIAAIFNDASQFETLLKSLRRDGYVKDFETTLKKTDNTPFFISLHSILFILNNQKHILMMIQDTTRQKTSELALIEKEKTLENANKFLQELNERKNKLLGMAAHDLRNPIGIIQMYSQFLLKGIKEKMDDTEIHFLQTICRTSNFMLHLIDDMLDISQIEKGELQLHIKEYDYISILQDIVDLNKVFAEQKKIRLLLSVESRNHVFAFDRNKIEQVLNNLITNAIKYSFPDTEILIKAIEKEDMMLTRVIDQGQGIPKDELANLFLAFEKTSVKPTGGEQSTGLGLAIAKRIIEGHHGEIGVESVPGKGSTFYFSIPTGRDYMK